MSIQVISAEIFKKEIFDYTQEQEFNFAGETPIILNFFATWCGPCQVFAPTLASVSDALAGKVKVYKIDIDQNPEVPALFGIRSVPTTVFFKKGEQPALATGNLGHEGLRQAVTELFGLPVPE